MDDEAAKKAAVIFRRIHGEVADDLDEELELSSSACWREPESSSSNIGFQLLTRSRTCAS